MAYTSDLNSQAVKGRGQEANLKFEASLCHIVEPILEKSVCVCPQRCNSTKTLSHYKAEKLCIGLSGQLHSGWHSHGDLACSPGGNTR